jgi:hypothetical protein
MNKNLSFFLSVVLLYVLPGTSQCQSKSEYKLYVKINPAMSTIDGKCVIQNPGDSSFYLTKDLKINKIIADGVAAIYHREASSVSGYTDLITLKGNIPHNLVIEYSGKIIPESYPNNVSSLNMIRDGLVELSDHIKWFPVMKNAKPFLYKLDLDMPSEYNSVTNLVTKKKFKEGGRNQTRWESSTASYGITLVASRNLKMRSIISNGITIEIYYSKLPVTYIDSMKNDLMKSMRILAGVFGTNGTNKLVRVVYSPRSAGGYARAPIIMVSENYALEQRAKKFGQARDLRLNTHEIAHYWSMAETNTPDDWINEGLAEYSALLISKELVGDDFYKVLLDEYNEIVKGSNSGCAIAETPGDSPDRELNRYYRPTLLLNDLHQKFGDVKMKEFLKVLYILFNETGNATTSVFLEAIEKVFGKETRDSFSESLYKKYQAVPEDIHRNKYLLKDSAFVGKWSGPLTQFGATVMFVLNIDVKNGELAPTCDSPDQNVFGIPVTELIMKGDSVSFKLGAALVSYRGYLNRIGNIITGEFKQRGSSYSLNLSKTKSKADRE